MGGRTVENEIVAKRVCLFAPVAEVLVMDTRYKALATAVERAINDADPIGLLEGGAPADEYSPELGTIVPRVGNAQSVDEITAVLHEEFARWFGNDTAGLRQAYEAPARKIWEALLEFRKGA